MLARFLSQADGQTGAVLHPSIHLGLNLICRGERETEGSNVSDARGRALTPRQAAAC